MGNVHRTRTTAVSETRPSYYNCVEIVYRLETEELQPISMLPAIPVAKKTVKVCLHAAAAVLPTLSFLYLEQHKDTRI